MMDRPAIVVVEDEPTSLSSLVEALARRFGADYRIVAHLSAKAAFEDLERMRNKGELVALIIADQWMPEISGAEFLGNVHELHPAAKRALMVAWGDRVAAPTIRHACAYGQLDNYILKPWAPPEVHLYPIINEFLAEWMRAYGPRLELVSVVGSDPSPRSHAIREQLERKGVPYGFHTSESEEGRALLAASRIEGEKLPAVILLDGHALIDPTDAELSDALGETDLEESSCDVAIVGAGPAGLAAAVYSASEGLRTIVVERETVGGQAGTSSLIRNYLGFPRGISGAELAQRAYQQAWLFGATYVFARGATALEVEGDQRILRLADGSELQARAVLVATGVTYRRSGIPSLERFNGAGLFYAAMGDLGLVRGRDVAVVGGGNSAGQAAVWLAQGARHVTMLVRGESLQATMSDYLIQQIRLTPNVEVRLHTEVIDGEGESQLEQITIRDRASGGTEVLRVAGVFMLIGARPHTDWLAGTLQRDAKGFILTGRDVEPTGWTQGRPPMQFETSVPGVFAVGDVRAGSEKRVASAVGEGSVAIRVVQEYLSPPVRLAPAAGPPGDGVQPVARERVVRPHFQPASPIPDAAR